MIFNEFFHQKLVAREDSFADMFYNQPMFVFKLFHVTFKMFNVCLDIIF